MLLISTTHKPASDLGFLLHKNPANPYVANTTFGRVFVVYPKVEDSQCEVALIIDVDPVKLVRGRNNERGTLANYVNDRPYVASSFLSVAIAEAFSTAMSGRSKSRQELAETPIPLTITIPVLPCRAGPQKLCELFEPLGYKVSFSELPLDEEFPEWGTSHYVRLTLEGTLLIRDALRHLYLLLPVLDAKKHYYMDSAEVDKLVQKGEGWLAQHPARDWIVWASLGRKPSMVRDALDQLANIEEDLQLESDSVDDTFIQPITEDLPAPKTSLHQIRHMRVIELVRELAPKSVVDLGCGEGKLLRDLIKIQGIENIVGQDVSYYVLEKANRKLHLDDSGSRKKERVQLIHGSLMYRDKRIEGFDVCTIVEVIEHLDPPRLAAFERVVFEFAHPKCAILTTPNREYNEVYGIADFRHSDHRFEWTRAEFAQWCESVRERFGYEFEIEGVGDADEKLGCPSQLAVFKR